MLKTTLLKSFKDNYIFMIDDLKNNLTAVVDPGDAQVVIKALNGKNLDAILLTHHHWDHTDGVKELQQTYPNVKTYGSLKDKARLPVCDVYLEEQDSFELFNTEVSVLFTPGHTLGHICYFIAEYNWLFCGDTVFLGGCGRMFEGDAQMYFTSLNKIKALPEDSLIFCTHEYSLANYRFIQKQEKEVSAALKQYIQHMKDQYKKTGATIPQRLKEEKEHNLFLKCQSAEEFGQLRYLKDIN